MSAKSNRQRKFMWVVHNMQRGKTPKSGKAGEAAASMNPEDVKDFLMQECGLKECGSDAKQRILKALKEIQKSMSLQEEESATPNVIASTKTAHGDFDQTLKMYRGFELTPKENQAIQSFDEVEPTAHDKFKVQYSKSDDYTNNSTIVVKKLKEPNGQFVYTALIKVRAGEDQPEEPPAEEPQSGAPPQTGTPPTQPQPQQPQQPMMEQGGGDEIKIIKSIPIDDKEGSEILTNFLQAVYHTKA